MSCNEEERTSIFMRAVGDLIAEYTHGLETDKHCENMMVFLLMPRRY